LWGTDGKPRGVEVTIAQGRARYHLANELVKNGTGRGFTELQDDDSAENFVKTFQEEPAGYTTDIALASTTKAIRLCLSKKNDGKYDGMDLLIQGPLNVMTLPRERWTAIKDDLIAAAKDMPFREIYVIGDSSRRPICFQIKRGNR